MTSCWSVWRHFIPLFCSLFCFCQSAKNKNTLFGSSKEQYCFNQKLKQIKTGKQLDLNTNVPLVKLYGRSYLHRSNHFLLTYKPNQGSQTHGLHLARIMCLFGPCHNQISLNWSWYWSLKHFLRSEKNPIPILPLV